MRKNSVKKRVVREEQVGVWVYVLLLTAVTILGWVLGNFDFSVGKTTLTIAIFAYPFRYFIANIITKKYGYKETFNAISYSACLLLFFAIVANILGQQEIDYVPLTGEISSPVDPPEACRFAPRCPYAEERCRTAVPALEDYGGGHKVACCLCSKIN